MIVPYVYVQVGVLLQKGQMDKDLVNDLFLSQKNSGNLKCVSVLTEQNIPSCGNFVKLREYLPQQVG